MSNIGMSKSGLVEGYGYCSTSLGAVDDNGEVTKSYKTWKSILTRVYNERFHITRPSYIGSSVSDEWLDFAVFDEWFHDNYIVFDGQRTDIDKDILVKGNKHYSPETCVFVPQIINGLFVTSHAQRGNLPIGTSYIRARGNFKAQLRINGKMNYIGTYNTPFEAFKAYKVVKELNIKSVADRYYGLITSATYDAMMKYEVEITD